MKTTISINLGGIAFTIDDDAYRELKNYLDALSDHFNKEEGGDEILADIEARIAEECARKRENGIQVISISMVQEIISRMGRIEDLTGEKTTETDGVKIEDPYFARTDNERVKGAKRLYRDPETAMLAGVSSGLAAYFDIDPSIPRIIFVLLTFFGGTGILIYIILWLVLPEADTPLKQSELRGESPTVKDIEKKFKDMVDVGKKKISEIDTEKAKESVRHGASVVANTVSHTIRTIIQIIARIIAVTFGVIGTLFSFIGIMALTFFAPFVLINSPERFIDIPVTTIFTTTTIYFLVIGAYFCLVIPLLFVLLISINILRKKNSITLARGFTLFGLWCAALIMTGIFAFKAVTSYDDYLMHNPAGQIINKEIPLDLSSSRTIESVLIFDGLPVEIVQGDRISLQVGGTPDVVNSIYTTIANGEFRIGKTNVPCLVCFRQTPHITLSLPSVSTVQINEGSRLVNTELVSRTPFTIILNDGSYAEVDITAPEVQAFTTDGSYLSLYGESENLTASAEDGSRIEAYAHSFNTILAEARSGSQIMVYNPRTLDARAYSGSQIIYYGNPELTIEEAGGGSVREERRLEILEP